MNRRPKRDDWPTSLRLATRLLDGLGVRQPWRFTGGSALASIHGHRFSRDADLFFSEAPDLLELDEQVQQLGYHTVLSPGHSLKILHDHGHIDLVQSRQITTLPTTEMPFEGRMVQREHPAEIVAKKMYFRGSNCTPRDVFDYAMLARRDAEAWLMGAVAAGYGGVHATREAMAERRDDFLSYARDEVATPEPFDPPAVWNAAEQAIASAYPVVLWADVAKQAASTSPYRDEHLERAIARAHAVDPDGGRRREAVRVMGALGLDPGEAARALLEKEFSWKRPGSVSDLAARTRQALQMPPLGTEPAEAPSRTGSGGIEP